MLGRADLRRALKAYVVGHDRGWTTGQKQDSAGSDDEAPANPAFDARPGDTLGLRIPVPEDLDFHRGPDMWRARGPRPVNEAGQE